MILIADSGSTKTDWYIGDDTNGGITYQTPGCNPYFMSAQQLAESFLLVQNAMQGKKPDHIWFYGAGCTPGEKSDTVRNALANVFGSACSIEVASDMLGAARALCGNREGIACILGTGSNSCLYDGHDITANVSPLGFILGDEGSGANLGKLFVGNVLKDQFDANLKTEFIARYGSSSDIIDRVYRQPLPNRWLASLSPFILQHIDDPKVKKMVCEAFKSFFTRNTANYHRPDLKIGMVGSVAYYYKDIISEAAADMGLYIGTIVRSPIEGLKAYHK